MNSLFTLSFWFQRIPPELTPFFEKGFFGLFVLLLIGGAVVRIIANHKQREQYVEAIFGRIGNMILTMGILGLLWFFFTYEQIPLLGARFWFLIWLASLLAWVAWILIFAYRKVPELRQADHDRKERMKYFPPRKKKKSKKR